MAARNPKALGLYVHWPFCRSLCPYCDFNSHVAGEVDDGRWCRALLAELDHFAALTPDRVLGTVFFGGGTPSLMAPETVAAILARADDHWTVDGAVEVTLEANPNATEISRMAEFRAAGINRVSLGVQALDDDALKVLGRSHDANQARAAIKAVASLFERFSFDLIYGRPGHGVAAWQTELDEALTLAQGHLSLYQLTMEPGTPFHMWHGRGDLVLPDDAVSAALFETTQDRLEGAGLPAYEISNHGVPGQECRHNLGYWRYGDFVGVGPGAHGRLTLNGATVATRQHRAPSIWLERVERDGHAARVHKVLDKALVGEEMLMMGLRTRYGVAGDLFAEKTGRSLAEVLPKVAVKALVDNGFLHFDECGLRATRAGRQRLNSVLQRLLV
ncbi:MAG: radical SAM family heme chaperone HemW [Alphaproteobacteria bacterium]